ncbi:hypothetical protein MOKP118_20610 [Mycobacterium avium subsp. hominissuis]
MLTIWPVAGSVSAGTPTRSSCRLSVSPNPGRFSVRRAASRDSSDECPIWLSLGSASRNWIRAVAFCSRLCRCPWIQPPALHITCTPYSGPRLLNEMMRSPSTVSLEYRSS